VLENCLETSSKGKKGVRKKNLSDIQRISTHRPWSPHGRHKTGTSLALNRTGFFWVEENQCIVLPLRSFYCCVLLGCEDSGFIVNNLDTYTQDMASRAGMDEVRRLAFGCPKVC